MTTEELIQRCISKNHDAWNEFVRRYRDLVARSVRYKLRKLSLGLPDTEFNDIVQEVFLHIWQKDKLSRIRDAACIRAWLAMVSVNITFNYCKSKAFRRERNAFSLDESIQKDEPGPTLGSLLHSDKLSTAKDLESNEIRMILEKEISELNPGQQLALKLNLYDGKKQKDIARIMGLSENTVASLIKRGKSRLKSRIEKIF
jgi:RNA polymerase sigma factor (sigma-70 family)